MLCDLGVALFGGQYFLKNCNLFIRFILLFASCEWRKKKTKKDCSNVVPMFTLST